MQEQEIQATIRILKKEVLKWRVPVIGHYTESPFTILISCLLSLRTQDKTTDAASARLFKLARTPQEMAKLPTSVIEKTIYPVGFYKTKAKNIKKICRRLLSQDNGRVPDNIDALLSLPGVGRKTANLVVTLGYQNRVSASIPTCTGSQTAGATFKPKRRNRLSGPCDKNFPSDTGLSLMIF